MCNFFLSSDKNRMNDLIVELLQEPNIFHIIKCVPSCHKYYERIYFDNIAPGIGEMLYDLYVACRRVGDPTHNILQILKKMKLVNFITNIPQYVHGCNYCMDFLTCVDEHRAKGTSIILSSPSYLAFWGSYEQIVFLHVLAKCIHFEFNPILLAIIAPSVDIYPQCDMDDIEIFIWALHEVSCWCKNTGICAHDDHCKKRCEYITHLLSNETNNVPPGNLHKQNVLIV